MYFCRIVLKPIDMNVRSVNKQLEASFKANWWKLALSNYKGETMNYAMVAERIEMIHVVFRRCGLNVGDRVAICGRNQANWGVCFLAAMTYGAVPVPILHEFHPDSIIHLLGHSESRVFFVDETVWSHLDTENLPDLEVVVNISDLQCLMSVKDDIDAIRTDVVMGFRKKYPCGLRPEQISYYEDKPDELAIINYTSGTSGFSKGVMIPYRAIACNMNFAANVAEPQMDSRSRVVSMLPLAHMYGLMFEFLFEMSIGAQVFFLTKTPSPKVIMDAFAQVRPSVIIAVPLIIEKVYKTQLKPVAEKLKFFFSAPLIGGIVRRYMRKRVRSAFGGVFEEVILGGAAVNPEVEKFFHKLHFPFTVGYGMTECAPIITYIKWNKAKVGSSGKAVPGCKIRIDSPEPSKIPGEVQVSGQNVFLGYYKNEKATKEAFTSDGWFRTGDMGVIKKGYLYLKGRSKCMILSANGQNIYPEELEGIINNFPYVVDSLVVEDHGGLTAIIYPDYAPSRMYGISKEEIEGKLNSMLPEVNKALPQYAQIRKIEFLENDFERTPKRNIKRYLYQKNK